MSPRLLAFGAAACAVVSCYAAPAWSFMSEQMEPSIAPVGEVDAVEEERAEPCRLLPESQQPPRELPASTGPAEGQRVVLYVPATTCNTPNEGSTGR